MAADCPDDGVQIDPEACARLLSRFLDAPVEFLASSRLTASSRAAPWRLEALVAGSPRSFVLQVDPRGMEHEYQVLEALEHTPIPCPRVYGLDLEGVALGFPCFVAEFIAGESLLGPLVRDEPWAEAVYFDAIGALHAVNAEDLAGLDVERLPVHDVLKAAAASFEERRHPLGIRLAARLRETTPEPPALRFSNGDLWLDNFIVRGQSLSGVIDFQHAAFSDPVFEFLLSFFVEPRLRGRGIEERFCLRFGYDAANLHWYRGLELLEVWRAVLARGEPFVHHTAASLEGDVERWLEG